MFFNIHYKNCHSTERVFVLTAILTLLPWFVMIREISKQWYLGLWLWFLAGFSKKSVQALLLYTHTFGNYSNSLFPVIDGHPVSYSFVTKQMSFTVSFIALHLKLYKGDSFYIGVATYAARMGVFLRRITLKGWSYILHIQVRVICCIRVLMCTCVYIIYMFVHRYYFLSSFRIFGSCLYVYVLLVHYLLPYPIVKFFYPWWSVLSCLTSILIVLQQQFRY